MPTNLSLSMPTTLSLSELDAEIGVKYFKEIYVDTQKDIWGVLLEEGNTYSIWVGSDPTFLDPKFTLKAPNLVAVGGDNDRNFPIDLDAYDEYTVPANQGGTYIVEVESNSGIGEYSLLVDQIA
jgi:hypothetical protein